MRLTTIIFVAITSIFLALAPHLSYQIIQHSIEYKTYKENYSETLNYKKRLFNTQELIFGDRAWKEKKAKASLNSIKAQNSLKTVNHKSIQLVLVMLIYISINSFIYYKRKRIRLLIIAITVVSSSALIIGILAPMLEIAAYENNLEIKNTFILPYFGEQSISKIFPGDMYFYYQSKSIYELISLLFDKNNIVVALSILIFSIVIPIVKLTFTILIILNPRTFNHNFFKLVVYHIAKWSMADVFVAATFLAYLSFNNLTTDISTVSHTLAGLHFFLGYCLLSIITGQILEKCSAKVP